jgi:hypothetical protein
VREEEAAMGKKKIRRKRGFDHLERKKILWEFLRPFLRL